eukprot:5570417-Amphidinium_carterae.1
MDCLMAMASVWIKSVGGPQDPESWFADGSMQQGPTADLPEQFRVVPLRDCVESQSPPQQFPKRSMVVVVLVLPRIKDAVARM